MQQEEINIQSLTGNEDIHVGYSDNNIVIIDSIQRFTEVSAAHVSMNAIVICLNGKVQAMINDQPLQIEQHQVVIIPPNVTVTDVMISPDFNMKAMFLTTSIIQSFLREKMNVWNDLLYVNRLHLLSVSEEDMVFFNRFYDMLQICFEKPADTLYRTEVIQSLLRGALLALCGALLQVAPPNAAPRQDAGTSNAHFRQFLELLHASTHQHRTVDSYAQELCITPKYLTTICKKHSGKTANEWIREQLLENIRYYLRHTDLSIKQVSDRLGFPNTSFFGKYVKEHFGLPPMQFRKQGYAEEY